MVNIYLSIFLSSNSLAAGIIGAQQPPFLPQLCRKGNKHPLAELIETRSQVYGKRNLRPRLQQARGLVSAS